MWGGGPACYWAGDLGTLTGIAAVNKWVSILAMPGVKDSGHMDGAPPSMMKRAADVCYFARGVAFNQCSHHKWAEAACHFQVCMYWYTVVMSLTSSPSYKRQ